MAPLYYIAILLTVVSNLAYHLCAKKTDGAINPFISLAVTYFTAFLLALLLIPFGGWSGGGVREQVLRLNWASFGLGAAIVFLEFGFILAYRQGWNISLAAVYSNVAVGILLLPVGIFFFAEHLGVTQAVGLALAIVGLFLMSTR